MPALLASLDLKSPLSNPLGLIFFLLSPALTSLHISLHLSLLTLFYHILSSPYLLTLTLSHSHALTLSHSHTRTLAHSHTLTLSHFHTLTLAHSHTHRSRSSSRAYAFPPSSTVCSSHSIIQHHTTPHSITQYHTAPRSTGAAPGPRSTQYWDSTRATHHSASFILRFPRQSTVL
jgi:hypothetical protein